VTEQESIFGKCNNYYREKQLMDIIHRKALFIVDFFIDLS